MRGAGVKGSIMKADALTQAVQSYASKVIRVFKKVGGRDWLEADETEVYIDGFDSVLILGKDQTRGEYKVKGVDTRQGGKVVKGRKFMTKNSAFTVSKTPLVFRTM